MEYTGARENDVGAPWLAAPRARAASAAASPAGPAPITTTGSAGCSETGLG